MISSFTMKEYEVIPFEKVEYSSDEDRKGTGKVKKDKGNDPHVLFLFYYFIILFFFFLLASFPIVAWILAEENNICKQ